MDKEEGPAVSDHSLDSVHQPGHLAYIGIGSNIGDRFASCRVAIQSLAREETVRISKVSSLFESAPMCVLDQDRFYNAVIEIKTTLSPHQLLHCSQEIEMIMGKKIVIPKGPRVIDLDLLFYDQKVIDAPDLTVPHPEIPSRRFVLIPMVEIAPEMRHPVLGQRMESLLERLKEESDFMVTKKEERGWEKVRP